jgi:hypothetical protein
MKKILALGISQSNFLNQLYGELIKRDASFSVDIDGYFELSGEAAGDTIYNDHLNLKHAHVKKSQVYRSLLSFARTALFWEILFFELSQKTKLARIKKILLGFAWCKHVVESQLRDKTYDIYHFHFCSPANLKFLYFLPKGTKSICSFWGSDLLRYTGVDNVFYVGKALSKAKAITVQSRELAEILYSKYGRAFSSKTNIVQFTIHTGIYEEIDRYRNDTAALDAFKTQNNIPLDRKIVCVGHNAFDSNNHLGIIKGMLDLPKSDKDKIAVILPLAYGREQKYLAELEAFTDAITDFPIVRLNTFLDPTQTALLRLCSEIMIQMPVTDALSGAMTETLYAGNHVVAASWLPYGILRRHDIQFDEADTFDEIAAILTRYLRQPEQYRQRSQANGQKIKSFLFPDKTTSDWRDIFLRQI